MSEFSERLKKIMAMLGIDSVAELSRRVGISQTTVYGWYYGKSFPHSKHRKIIFEKLGITEAQLYSDEAIEAAKSTENNTVNPALKVKPTIDFDMTAMRYEIVMKMTVEIMSVKPVNPAK